MSNAAERQAWHGFAGAKQGLARFCRYWRQELPPKIELIRSDQKCRKSIWHLTESKQGQVYHTVTNPAGQSVQV
jgi:hypothetical protein